MKIKSIFSGQRKESLQLIISKIVRAADPEKILLLSASYEYRITENIFVRNPVQEFRAKNYNLLVLFNEGGRNVWARQKTFLLNLLNSEINLQVMDMHEFNEDIRSGNEFANYVLLKAMVWYDKEQSPFVYPDQDS